MKMFSRFFLLIVLFVFIGFPMTYAQSNVRKSITITGLESFNGREADMYICSVFPWESEQTIANKYNVEIINGSVVFQLEEEDSYNRWTGSGSYYIYFDILDIDGELEYELIYAPGGDPAAYNINTANVSLVFSNFKNIAAL